MVVWLGILDSQASNPTLESKRFFLSRSLASRLSLSRCSCVKTSLDTWCCGPESDILAYMGMSQNWGPVPQKPPNHVVYHIFPVRLAIKLGNCPIFWDQPTSRVTASTTLSLNLAGTRNDTTQNTDDHWCERCPSVTGKIDRKPWFLTERKHKEDMVPKVPIDFPPNQSIDAQQSRSAS